MKIVIAYIQPFMLDKVVAALRERRVPGMTVLEAKGFGRQTNEKAPHFLDKGVRIDFAPKVKIEVVCKDEEVDGIVDAIRLSAHTGRHGDGKIFVVDVQKAVSIRTGQSGEMDMI
jgi:nitrogen regulatory protein PII